MKTITINLLAVFKSRLPFLSLMTFLLGFKTLSVGKQKIFAASQWKKMERRKRKAMWFDLSQRGDHPHGEESLDGEENLERKWESPMCRLCSETEKKDTEKRLKATLSFESGL